MQSVRQPSNYLLASDFWGHWHFGASSGAAGLYYTNILYFDLRVEGRAYETERKSLAFLSWDGVRRWWIPSSGPSPE